MFELCAIIGLDIDKKPNIELIQQYEQQSEILEIYPENLKKSQLISQFTNNCFPNGELFIYSEDGKLIHPFTKSNITKSINAKLHYFSVELNQEQKFCYILSFYETAYIQTKETLTGNKVKVLTWIPQIEINQGLSSRSQKSLFSTNSLHQSYLKVYIQKSIVLVSNFYNQEIMSQIAIYIYQQFTTQQEQNLSNILEQIQSKLFKINRIPNFNLYGLITYCKNENQMNIEQGLDENQQNILIPLFQCLNHQPPEESNINKEIYNLLPLEKNIFKNPPDKVQQYIKKVRELKKQPKKPLVPIMPNQYDRNPLRKYEKKIQDFSFHEQKKRNQIFRNIQFSDQKPFLI